MHKSDKIISREIIDISEKLVSFVMNNMKDYGHGPSEKLIKSATSLRLASIFLIEASCDKSCQDEMNKDVDDCVEFILDNFDEIKNDNR